MIRISIKDSAIKVATKRIEDKVDQAKFAVSPTSMAEIAKATFTLSAKQFVKEIGIEAVNNPENYHHIYEWNKIGSPASKLFLVKRVNVQGGHLVINIDTIQSNSTVPIRSELRKPGKTGKRVSAKHVFKNKAKVMEEGKPVKISSQNVLTFYDDNSQEIVFISSGRSVRVNRPGGRGVKGSLTKFSRVWFRTRPPQILAASRLIGQISNAVAKTVSKNNSSKSEVLKSIKLVTGKYSKEISVI